MNTVIDLHERPFVSISGEAGFFPQGSICTFIRFQGCNLRPPCAYCDTVHAQRFNEGIPYSVESVLRECQTKQVLITGGEPLASKICTTLIEALLSAGHLVQVETNGSLTIPTIPGMQGHGGWVVDRKGPSSETQLPLLCQLGEEFFGWNRNPVIFKYVAAPTTSPYYHLDRDFIADDMWELDDMGYKGKFIISPMDADAKEFGNLFCFPREFWDRVIISLQIHKIMGMA